MAEETGPEGRRALTLFEDGKCGRCLYFSRKHDEEDSGYEGFCHRYPPSVPDGSGDSDFVQLDAGCMGCGEFAPADPRTPTEASAVLARMVLLGDMTAAYALADRLKSRETD